MDWIFICSPLLLFFELRTVPYNFMITKYHYSIIKYASNILKKLQKYEKSRKYK